MGNKWTYNNCGLAPFSSEFALGEVDALGHSDFGATTTHDVGIIFELVPSVLEDSLSINSGGDLDELIQTLPILCTAADQNLPYADLALESLLDENETQSDSIVWDSQPTLSVSSDYAHFSRSSESHDVGSLFSKNVAHAITFDASLPYFDIPTSPVSLPMHYDSEEISLTSNFSPDSSADDEILESQALAFAPQPNSALKKRGIDRVTRKSSKYGGILFFSFFCVKKKN
jgi:hypothetical protein